MNEINRITGRNYGLFNYYGAADAEKVIIAMGSSSEVIQTTVEHLNAQGEKVGLLVGSSLSSVFCKTLPVGDAEVSQKDCCFRQDEGAGVLWRTAVS
jgi:hypothetical protein